MARALLDRGLEKILEMLRKNDTSATFFVVGELLETNPEIFDKIIENEHEIAFHTMSHTRIDSPNFIEKFRAVFEILKIFDQGGWYHPPRLTKG